MVLPSIYLIVF